MRFLVETSDGEPPFTIDRNEPPALDESITREGTGRVYTVRFVEPGRDDFDNVLKADLIGTVGPGHQQEYRP
jgi:hypothetical protein